MLTRKTYKLVAKAIARAVDDAAPDSPAHNLIFLIAEDLATEFAHDNPRFSYLKFMQACHLVP